VVCPPFFPRLLLNPNEDDHKQLTNLIRGSSKSAIQIFAAENDEEKKQEANVRLTEGMEQVTKLSQEILKREWERVKRAE
jgi:hypothetical protein